MRYSPVKFWDARHLSLSIDNYTSCLWGEYQEPMILYQIYSLLGISRGIGPE